MTARRDRRIRRAKNAIKRVMLQRGGMRWWMDFLPRSSVLGIASSARVRRERWTVPVAVEIEAEACG